MVSRNPILEQLGGNPLAAVQDLANHVRDTRETYFDFAVGDPDEPTPEIVRAGLLEAASQTRFEPESSGIREFREAVADWLHRRHRVTVDPDTQVLASAGSKEAIFHLPFAVIDRSEQHASVIYGTPGYPIYGRGAVLAGAWADAVPLADVDSWLLRLEALQRASLDRARVAWLNYPHNPTGASASLGYYERQLAVARRHNILLCSDEPYQDLWYVDRPPSALEACRGDMSGVLVFLSLSKRSGMTGYRVGAIVGDSDIIDHLRNFRDSAGTVPSLMVQKAAIAALRDDQHVEDRREIFARKRDILLEFLASHEMHVSGSEAAFYIWFRAPEHDDEIYVENLLAEGIIATPGRAFGQGGEGWIRLALVPTVAECERAVETWSAAIKAGRLPC